MKKAFRLSWILSLVMTLTGSIVIPAVAHLDAEVQNLLYRIGSMPLMFLVALYVYRD